MRWLPAGGSRYSSSGTPVAYRMLGLAQDGKAGKISDVGGRPGAPCSGGPWTGRRMAASRGVTAAQITRFGLGRLINGAVVSHVEFER